MMWTFAVILNLSVLKIIIKCKLIKRR